MTIIGQLASELSEQDTLKSCSTEICDIITICVHVFVLCELLFTLASSHFIIKCGWSLNVAIFKVLLLLEQALKYIQGVSLFRSSNGTKAAQSKESLSEVIALFKP